jgi:hypothetical protein
MPEILQLVINTASRFSGMAALVRAWNRLGNMVEWWRVRMSAMGVLEEGEVDV